VFIVRLSRIFLFLLAILSSANAMSASPVAVSASAAGANKFINKVGDATLDIVSSKKFTSAQKEQELTKLFESSVDIEWIAKFVIGSYGRGITPEQNTEYNDLYHKFLLQSYVPKFRQYTNQKIVIINTHPESEGEFSVQTEIKTPDQPSIRVDYKVKMVSGQYKIFDIVAEGVSLITTQRSEFGSILSRNGLGFLIEKLKEKVAKS
jgi:phospholipid transport system substrate-binding protein